MLTARQKAESIVEQISGCFEAFPAKGPAEITHIITITPPVKDDDAADDGHVEAEVILAPIDDVEPGLDAADGWRPGAARPQFQHRLDRKLWFSDAPRPNEPPSKMDFYADSATPRDKTKSVRRSTTSGSWMR